jgi:hypothetical protein
MPGFDTSMSEAALRRQPAQQAPRVPKALSGTWGALRRTMTALESTPNLQTCQNDIATVDSHRSTDRRARRRAGSTPFRELAVRCTLSPLGYSHANPAASVLSEVVDLKQLPSRTVNSRRTHHLSSAETTRVSAFKRARLQALHGQSACCTHREPVTS